jgi:hypothetical protein
MFGDFRNTSRASAGWGVWRVYMFRAFGCLTMLVSLKADDTSCIAI